MSTIVRVCNHARARYAGAHQRAQESGAAHGTCGGSRFQNLLFSFRLHVLELEVLSATMSKQKTLFSCGVTSRVKLASGREVEVKGKDVADEKDIEKVGAFRCKFCNFTTHHPPALNVYVSMKHPTDSATKSGDQKDLGKPADSDVEDIAKTASTPECVLVVDEGGDDRNEAVDKRVEEVADVDEPSDEDELESSETLCTVGTAGTGVQRSGQSKRHRYTLNFRKTCLEWMDQLRADGHKTAVMETSRKFGIPHANLVKWAKPKARADLHAGLTNGQTCRNSAKKNMSKAAKKTHLHHGSRPRFHIAEVETHQLYKLHRSQGRRVSGHWLTVQMKKQVKTIYGDFVHSTFRASRGWFNAFLSRFRITLRKQTNTKAKSVEQRKAGIQQWHARLRRRIKRGTDVHPKWGRWLPENRFNVD